MVLSHVDVTQSDTHGDDGVSVVMMLMMMVVREMMAMVIGATWRQS